MLVLAGIKLKNISDEIPEAQPTILHLDVSGNYLKSGADFAKFPQLESLIIDNNYYFSLDDFPVMPNLRTLSANKNNFNNLEIFLQQCHIKFPKLIHLSLIKNPLCPMFLGEDEYQRYRYEVIKNCRQLLNLDGTPVDPKEINPNYQQIKNQQKQAQNKSDEETKGTIEFNQKYTKPGSKTVKSRSEGNRFVKNNQL